MGGIAAKLKLRHVCLHVLLSVSPINFRTVVESGGSSGSHCHRALMESPFSSFSLRSLARLTFEFQWPDAWPINMQSPTTNLPVYIGHLPFGLRYPSYGRHGFMIVYDLLNSVSLNL